MSLLLGYVSNYTLDPNTGLINSGTLNTVDPTSTSGNPITINLDANSNMYAIINVNKITSPNINDQYLPMTNDSKYILLNNYTAITKYLYYIIMYACINYNITIPSFLNSDFFNKNITDNDFTPDNTYNQLTTENRKTYYKFYLIGLNPPPKLLQKINNPKIWNDIGYVNKSVYDYDIINPNSFNPPNFCLPFVNKITDPNSQLVTIDCSYLPKASPVISSSNNTLGITTDNTSMGIGVSICICICCCCVVIGGVFLMMSMKSKSKLKKK